MFSDIDFAGLVEKAWAAGKNSYSPYSGFSVGAALITDTGQIFCGCNVENLSFGLTICAERAAVMAAITAGYKRFAAMAIAAETNLPIVPCGACRQFLAEFEPNLTLFSQGKGEIKEFSLSNLLPFPSEGILNRQN